jgi:hypothetical protein
VTTAYTDLRARAAADDSVLGLVLFGSVARGMGTAHSDVDVFVVVGADRGGWVTSRTAELDTVVLTVDELAHREDRWQRYSYRGARVLFDRAGGRVGELVAAQGTLTAQETDAWSREYLDGYVNFAYRAAKSRRDGRDDLARLDEIELVSWFLWALFAMHGRVRPYNKYLRWELSTYPLPLPWTADELVATLTDRPAAMFGGLERIARARGFGDVLDGWDDLHLLR